RFSDLFFNGCYSFISDRRIYMKSGRKISKNIKENEAYLKKRLGIDESFDLGFREIIVLGKSVQLYYVNGLNNSSLINQKIDVLKSMKSLPIVWFINSLKK